MMVDKNQFEIVYRLAEKLSKSVPSAQAEWTVWGPQVISLYSACINGSRLDDNVRLLVPIEHHGDLQTALSWLNISAGTSFTFSQAHKIAVSNYFNKVVSILAKGLSAADANADPFSEVDEQFDAMLPLASKKWFENDIPKAIQVASPDIPFSLLMADIDHFKSVNDTHGHPIGDEVLKGVAEIIRAVSKGKGKGYRYGGEELSVLLPNHTVIEAAAVAERIRTLVANRKWSIDSLQVKISIGVSCCTGDRDPDGKLLIKGADDALYRAKKEGRNRVCAASATILNGGNTGITETEAIAFINGSRTRARGLMGELGANFPTYGIAEYAFSFSEKLPVPGALDRDFLDRILAALPRMKGYSPWYDTRTQQPEEFHPRVYNGAWEAFYYQTVKDGDNGRESLRRMEYWAIQPQGVFSHTRIIDDDTVEIGKRTLGKEMSANLTTWRVAEVLLMALGAAQKLFGENVTAEIRYQFRWSNLKGRELNLWDKPGLPFAFETGKAIQNEENASAVLKIVAGKKEVVETTQRIVESLFRLFEGNRCPQELAEMAVEGLCNKAWPWNP